MKRKILVVDDEPEIRMLIRAILETTETAVDEAPDGQAVRALLGGPAAEAMLLDISLPDGSAVHLLPEIRKQWPSTPIILMSGFLADDLANHVSAEQGIHFLGKPFEIEELQGMVQRVIAT